MACDDRPGRLLLVETRSEHEITAPPRPFALSPDAVVRRLGDGGVIVDLRTNAIFELNETSIRIWELLVEGHPLHEVASVLASEYEIDTVTALRECESLVERLRTDGLLH